MTQLINWDFAAATARRLVRPGPQIPPAEAAEVVQALRVGAQVSEGHVREFTGLRARPATAPVLVVDRPGWIQANTDGFRTVLSPLLAKIAQERKLPTGPAQLVGSRVTGAELGALLAFLAPRVLGQFDPFWEGGRDDTGRMLLVAPNIVQTVEELDVDPHDFRLWVCLHEETHRVQFTAVPWLRDYIRSLIEEFMAATEIDPEKLASLLAEGIRDVVDVLRGSSNASLAEIFASPEQRAVIDKMTAVMSLLEGHADVVMDGVGPSVIASVAEIRAKFDKRRGGRSPVDVLLRRLLGLDAKMRQYRDGASFVRGAVESVGMERFNRVWTDPQTLPSKAEIADPAAWVARVHA